MNMQHGSRINVMVSSQSRKTLTTFENILHQQPNIELVTNHRVNGTVDPLKDATRIPDLLIMELGKAWQDELDAVSSRPVHTRPAIIALSNEDNTRVMRSAMQAGVRDFFTYPLPVQELLESVNTLASESYIKGASQNGKITAFINAKGGSGASFIAANVGHILSSAMQHKVAIIDLDLQFGTLPLYLDLNPKYTLLDMLEATDELDSMALEGFMSKHHSGLHVLSSMSDTLGMSWEVPETNMAYILEIAKQQYQNIIIDLPRQIDPLTSCVIEHADMVFIVIQQSLTHLRDARRLMQILTKEIGMPTNHIKIIINRFNDKHQISLLDIKQAMKNDDMLTLQNDYKRVSESINSGQPLREIAKSAAITESLTRIAYEITGDHSSENQGVLRKAVSYLFN